MAEGPPGRHEWVDPGTGKRWAAVRDAGLPITKTTLASEISPKLGWLPEGCPEAAIEILRLVADLGEHEKKGSVGLRDRTRLDAQNRALAEGLVEGLIDDRVAKLTEERDALKLALQESSEVEAELVGALARLTDEELTSCSPPCPGHLGEKALAMIRRAREAWDELDTEVERRFDLILSCYVAVHGGGPHPEEVSNLAEQTVYGVERLLQERDDYCETLERLKGERDRFLGLGAFEEIREKALKEGRREALAEAWIFDRLPDLPDLSVVFERGTYRVYGGTFWVWDGREVKLAQFEKPPNEEEGGFYVGYWNARLNGKAWMPFRAPSPPTSEGGEPRPTSR